MFIFKVTLRSNRKVKFELVGFGLKRHTDGQLLPPQTKEEQAIISQLKAIHQTQTNIPGASSATGRNYECYYLKGNHAPIILEIRNKFIEGELGGIFKDLMIAFDITIEALKSSSSSSSSSETTPKENIFTPESLIQQLSRYISANQVHTAIFDVRGISTQLILDSFAGKRFPFCLQIDGSHQVNNVDWVTPNNPFSIRELIIREEFAVEGGNNLISQFINFCQLHTLILSTFHSPTDEGEAGLILLFNAISKPECNLTTLSVAPTFQNQNLAPKTNLLKTSIKNNTIVNLRLAQITKWNAIQLVTMLGLSALSSLSLPWCELQKEDPRLLAQLLATNPITELDLSHNRIGDAEMAETKATDFVTALAGCPTLKSVDLEDNHIADSDTKAIADWTRTNTSLTRLNLIGNSFQYQGVTNLVAALTTNQHLIDLDIETVRSVPLDIIPSIPQTLIQNKSLARLTLRINKECLPHVIDIISQNKRLNIIATWDNKSIKHPAEVNNEKNKNTYHAVIDRNILNQKIERFNWFMIAATLAFLRANHGHTFQTSILPLLPIFKRLANLDDIDLKKQTNISAFITSKFCLNRLPVASKKMEDPADTSPKKRKHS